MPSYELSASKNVQVEVDHQDVQYDNQQYTGVRTDGTKHASTRVRVCSSQSPILPWD
jgi:hypothetical protein